MLLEDRGYWVQVATGGAEALQLFSSRPVDLVLIEKVPKGVGGVLDPSWLPNPALATKGGVNAKDCTGIGHVKSLNTDGKCHLLGGRDERRARPSRCSRPRWAVPVLASIQRRAILS